MAKITPLQIYMLFSQFLYATTLGFYIGPLAQEAGFSAIYSMLFGSLLGLAVVYLSYRLAMRRPSGFFAQYGSEIMGKWIHIPLSLLMVASLLLSSAYVLRELERIITGFYLRGTPPWAAGALIGLCVVRAIKSGAGTIFRGAQGLFLLSVLSALAIPLLSNKAMNRSMAIAFMTNIELPGTWNAAMLITTLFGEMAFIVFYFPYFTKGERTMRSLGWATLTAIIITLGGFASIVLLFGPDLTANLSMPTLEMIRFIRFDAFFQNFDPLLLVFWLYSMFIKISLLLYTAAIGLTHTFGFKDHRPISSFMTAALVIISLYMVSTEVELDRVMQSGLLAFLLLAELIPALYLMVDCLRFGRMRPRPGASPD